VEKTSYFPLNDGILKTEDTIGTYEKIIPERGTPTNIQDETYIKILSMRVEWESLMI
jgi:hypothetical protein